ncbi:hypothetical protein PM082_021945 [Marasmius tenuissimus]|nr:hypothetical protein PM082_021945 [Marasmius tenuissimus]
MQTTFLGGGRAEYEIHSTLDSSSNAVQMKAGQMRVFTVDGDDRVVLISGFQDMAYNPASIQTSDCAWHLQLELEEPPVSPPLNPPPLHLPPPFHD